MLLYGTLTSSVLYVHFFGDFENHKKASYCVVGAVQRYNFHPTQQLIKNKDGTTTIKMKADGFYEMSWYLFQWQDKIKPVAPKLLVDTYYELLNNLVKNSKK